MSFCVSDQQQSLGNAASTSTRPTKRTKTAGAASNVTEATAPQKTPVLMGMRGEYAAGGFLDMPVEILFEIFGWARPEDLLSLTRTSKPLRSILRNRRTALSTWKSAFARHYPDMPACPPGMDEPRYARFMCSRECHGECEGLAGEGETRAFWYLRVRYCQPCLDKRVINRIDSKAPYYHCVPIEYVFPAASAPYRRPQYLLGDVESFNRQLDELPPGEERDAFIEREEERMRGLHEHVAKCMKWEREQNMKHHAELARIRERRFDGIVQRIVDLGYGDELDRMESEEFRSLVRVDDHSREQELTDREWDRIELDIVGYLKRRRSEEETERRGDAACEAEA
ncbi:hypothetical protein PLICRDRAFT_47362 [Plicaturopsis crispa FD-325 SS-3]|uniref:F-box domain-containing protein n=1 Tax=Plicaturopsis crispa FD-325 SS-3 TaxID=944288 RepID=A0A0C9SK89_PLICR|nr:hypothetical protein PLICRDRAFT_47362 [Plicaturopsis crispa FD-325 SS-3]